MICLQYDQHCLQMSRPAGIMDSSIPGLLQAWSKDNSSQTTYKEEVINRN